jgi:hypothetical protein
MARSRLIPLALLALASLAVPVRAQNAQSEYLFAPPANTSPIRDQAYDLLPTDAAREQGNELPPAEQHANNVALDPQFEHGKPRKIVDAAGWVWGIPRNIILWDRRAVNHHVSCET